MAVVKGTVEAMSNKFDKFSVLVDGNWYSSKFEIKCNKGDEVEFDDGDKKYCRKLKVISSGGGGSFTPATGGSGYSGSAPTGFPVAYTTKDRSIVRQNSLTHATSLVNNFLKVDVTVGGDPASPAEDVEMKLERIADTVIAIARKFEDYSAGDGDMRDAKEMLEKEG